MFQLLFKLDPNDSSHFGRKMKREGREETVNNLIAWLHQEASIRFRGKSSSVSWEMNESRVDKGPMPPMRSQKSSSKLDSGSNTSQLSKNAARRLGVNGSATHLTMNLAGGEKKSEPSQILDITLASPTDKDITKTLQVYTVTRPCSNAKTISKELVGQ